MMKRLTILLVALISLGAQAANEVIVKSKPVSATVFTSGGAAITREGSAKVAAGRTILKIDDLPSAIDFSTLRIKVGGGAMVMSVKSGVTFDDGDMVAQRQVLNRKMYRCDSLYNVLYVERDIVRSRIELLTKNNEFGSNGLADANAQKAYEMYSREMETLKKRDYELDSKMGAIKSLRAGYQTAEARLNSTPATRKSYALIEVESKKEQSVKLEINYRVGDVLWIPSYDVRAENGGSEADLIMKARVRQNSGEDWNGVKLRLSTAIANQRADAPELSQYFVNYGSRPPFERRVEHNDEINPSLLNAGAITGRVFCEDDGQPVIGATVSIKGRNVFTMTDVNGRFTINSDNPSTTLTFQYVGLISKDVNCNFGRDNIVKMQADNQNVENVVVTGYGTRRQAKALSYAVSSRRGNYREDEPEINLINTTEVENSTAKEIEIDGLTSVPSKQEPYSIDVKGYTIPMYYAYVSAPRIDQNVYMQLRLMGMDKLTLLDGELNLFFDNTLLNTSVLRHRNLGDTTVIGINIDKRIVVRRDAVEGEPRHQIVGSKWVATRHWNYSLANNGSSSIVVELSDRVPVSSNKEIAVSTTHNIAPVSNNDGILTWRIELAAGQSKQFDLKYVVTCPKNRTVDVD